MSAIIHVPDPRTIGTGGHRSTFDEIDDLPDMDSKSGGCVGKAVDLSSGDLPSAVDSGLRVERSVLTGRQKTAQGVVRADRPGDTRLGIPERVLPSIALDLALDALTGFVAIEF